MSSLSPGKDWRENHLQKGWCFIPLPRQKLQFQNTTSVPSHAVETYPSSISKVSSASSRRFNSWRSNWNAQEGKESYSHMQARYCLLTGHWRWFFQKDKEKESSNWHFSHLFLAAGKNGVYCNLVRNVREAFEECELVRINCQGLNPSDFRRIGAKLRV